MLLNWLDTRLAKLGLAVAAIGITVLALIPGKEVPVTTGWDKTDHWSAFFTLALLVTHAFPQASFWRRIVPALIAYGIGIEIAQALTPDRSADWHDVVADAIGVFGYGAIAHLVQRLRQAFVSESG